MAVSCSIKFTQGSSPGTGGAMLGSTGSPVTVSNGLATPAIVRSQFWIVDAPPSSVYYAYKGTVVQDGAAPTYAFTPDVQYGFLIEMVCFDALGNQASDQRCFGVLDANGLFVPPFEGDNLALNFVLSGKANTRGWAPFMEAWLAFLTTHAGGSVGFTVEGLGAAFGSPAYSGLANRVVLIDPTGGYTLTPVAGSMGTKGNYLQVKLLPGIVPTSTNKLTINPVTGGTLEQPVTAAAPGTYASTPVVLSQAGMQGASLTYVSDGAGSPNLFLG